MRLLQMYEKSCLLKLTKREFEVVQYIIVNDDSLDPYFDVVTYSDTLTCVVTQLSDKSVEMCIDYFNHCFASDLINSMIRFDKIDIIKNKLK